MTERQGPTMRETLDYATPGSDALWTRRHAAADAAVDGLLSLRAARRAIGGASMAALCIRSAIGRRYAAETAGEACVRCGASPCRGVVVLRWRFTVPPPPVALSSADAQARETAETAFACCAACDGALRRRLGRARALAVAGGIALLFGAFAAVLAAASSNPRELRPATFVAAALMAAGVASMLAGGALKQASLSAAITRAVPRWLRFEEHVSFAERTPDAR